MKAIDNEQASDAVSFLTEKARREGAATLTVADGMIVFLSKSFLESRLQMLKDSGQDITILQIKQTSEAEDNVKIYS